MIEIDWHGSVEKIEERYKRMMKSDLWSQMKEQQYVNDIGLLIVYIHQLEERLGLAKNAGAS